MKNSIVPPSRRLLPILVLALLAIGSVRPGSAADNSVHDAPVHIKHGLDDVLWGAQTNSLRSGLLVGRKFARERRIVLQAGDPVSRKVEVLVGNDSTEHALLFQLPEEQRFKLKLVDSDGRPVPRTKAGSSLGKEPAIKPGTTWRDVYRARTFRPASLFPGSVNYGPELDIRDYFHLNDPGTYEFTMIQRVLGVEKGLVVVVELPPVKIEVVVE